MNGVSRWLGLLLRHPVALADTPLIAARAALRKNLYHKPSLLPDGDVEVLWQELRGNWVLEAIDDRNIDAAVARFRSASASAERWPLEAYSAAQRIGNAIYLLRAHTPLRRPAIAEELCNDLIRDATFLSTHVEFRGTTAWFNNHLLNDYRAAVLLENERSFFPGMPSMSGLSHDIANLMVQNLGTLFSSDGVLLEGSVSYELLGLKHLVDISCSRAQDQFAQMARRWLLPQRDRILAEYRKEDCWIIPQIGDCSPDWTPNAITLFLDGFALAKDTAYRRIWHEELSASGF